MDSPLLARPGAVPAQGIDAGVAAHYGDPYAEQRALARAAGLVDRSHRGVVRITGEDRLSWLNTLTTQDLAHLAPGTAAQALLLSPQGHIEHHLTLADDGSAVWAHVEPGTAGALLAFLESMRFLLRVEPADVTGDYAVLTLMGPARSSAPPAGTVVAMPDSLRTDLVVPRDRLAQAAAAAPGPRHSLGAWKARCSPGPVRSRHRESTRESPPTTGIRTRSSGRWPVRPAWWTAPTGRSSGSPARTGCPGCTA